MHVKISSYQRVKVPGRETKPLKENYPQHLTLICNNSGWSVFLNSITYLFITFKKINKKSFNMIQG